MQKFHLMEVSATILTHNSSKTISKTLESIKDIATDIVIVDDHSSDDTLQIVSSLRPDARIFKRSLSSDFAAQRNFSLEKCKFNWVLVIDSDEELTLELKENLRQAIIAESSAPAFTCKRKNLSFIGASYNWLERPILQKKEFAYKFSIHERIEPSLKPIDGLLIHNSWLGLEQFVDDINTYSSWKAQMWINQGRNYSIPFITIRQIAFTFYIFLRRWIFEGRFKTGWIGFAYSLTWATEELFVALKFIQYKKEKQKDLHI